MELISKDAVLEILTPEIIDPRKTWKGRVEKVKFELLREQVNQLPSQWIEINDVTFGKVYQNSFITFLSTDTFEGVKARLSRPKGKWIEDTGLYATCSNCKENLYQAIEYKFCPSCGAEMEER